MSVKLSLTVRPSGDRFLQLISPRFNTLVDTPLATEPRKSTATLTTENKGYESCFTEGEKLGTWDQLIKHGPSGGYPLASEQRNSTVTLTTENKGI
ncbi:hypothetical protein CEXT_470021 [Caerostris extrusa]|uniref:Uncharacterized protein n=1 Tax=Caerostris extrusa TaxID=172846 RepID=A0AAV4NV11_CAEEX|nr:hypothetical protein CEXT_470021 [Caerostris extrusa]